MEVFFFQPEFHLISVSGFPELPVPRATNHNCSSCSCPYSFRYIYRDMAVYLVTARATETAQNKI